nr:unnamed protein product [Callosobruchus analis]
MTTARTTTRTGTAITGVTTPSVISVVVLMDMESFKKQMVDFLRDTSRQLRTVVKVKKDHLKNDMIYPWA